MTVFSKIPPVWRAILARAGWAAASAGVAILATVVADVPPQWAWLAGGAFSALKSWIATHTGTGGPTFSPSSIEAPNT